MLSASRVGSRLICQAVAERDWPETVRRAERDRHIEADYVETWNELEYVDA
jgi:hypothetical protein